MEREPSNIAHVIRVGAYLLAAGFLLVGTRSRYDSGQIDGTQALLRLAMILLIVVAAIVPAVMSKHARAAEIRRGATLVLFLCVAVLLVFG